MKKILVVNPFGIGDVIFTMVMVEAIRKARPDARICFLCNERTETLVRMNSSIDKTFVFHRDLYRKLWKRNPVLMFQELKGLLGVLRKERFDTLLDLSLGREYSFYAMLIGIKKRVGFDFKGRGIFLTQKKKIKGYTGEPAADTQLRLLDFLGIPYEKNKLSISLMVTGEAISDAEAYLGRSGFSDKDRVIAVAPGGGKSWGDKAIFKQWDPERFARAVNLFAERDGCKVVVLGDKSEEELLKRTAAMIEPASLVVSGEPFDRVCALLLRSEFLLCNDGGLLHLGNALGVKTVSIFGPVDEKVYGPYGDGTPHIVLSEPVPCRPCYQYFYFPPCPYERRCLCELGAEKVVAALEKIAYSH